MIIEIAEKNREAGKDDIHMKEFSLEWYHKEAYRKPNLRKKQLLEYPVEF